MQVRMKSHLMATALITCKIHLFIQMLLALEHGLINIVLNLDGCRLLQKIRQDQ